MKLLEKLIYRFELDFYLNMYCDFVKDYEIALKKIRKNQYKYLKIINAEGLKDEYIKLFFDNYTKKTIEYIFYQINEQKSTHLTNIEMYDLIEVCENEKIENIKRDKLRKLQKIYTKRLNMLYLLNINYKNINYILFSIFKVVNESKKNKNIVKINKGYAFYHIN